jgi:hypothetical protein
VAEVPLTLAQREVDDLAAVLLADLHEGRRDLRRIGLARGSDEALALDSALRPLLTGNVDH